MTAGLWLAAGLVISGCEKPQSQPVQAATARTATSNAPLGFARTSPDAQVTLSLPEPIKQYPDLHSRLYSDGETTLTAFMDQAKKSHAEQSADGFPVPAYYQKIEWKISAQSPRLVSLYAEQNDFEGGAHPNTSFKALLWDKDKTALVPASELFAPGADLKGIDAYVCHQIEAERAKRSGQPINQLASGFNCPKFADSKLILIPSTQPGKIGAVDALFAPYEVGPYAEGPYEIRVPQSQLQGLIAPQYAGQFAGDAVNETAFADPDANKDQAQ
ncbi:MAG: PdaC/SigV domain-containing protein [Asticcacaulis sp.]